MEKILTISIAGYNVEKYIRQALDSLCCPEIIPYLEVFIIDDGGTDKTFEIAGEYEKIYPGSFRAVHKENGGWGSTVNYAISHASGKYFRLLDGDDFFDTEGLKQLVKILLEIQADVVYTPYTRFDNESGKIVKRFYASKNVPKNKLLEISEIMEDETDFVLPSSTFLTKVLQEHNIKIQKHCFYTDNEFRAKAMAYVKTAYILDCPVYQYRVGRQGQSISLNGLKKNYRDNLKIIQELILFMDRTKEEINREVIVKYIKNAVLFHYNALIRLGLDEELKEFDDLIRQYGERYYTIHNRMIVSLRSHNFSNLKWYTHYMNTRIRIAPKILILFNRNK